MYRVTVASGVGVALLVHASLVRADCKYGLDPMTGKCFERLPPPLPAPPSLEISSDPPGARVSRIDPSTGSAVPLGEMPAGGYRLSAGRHRLLLSLAGYADEPVDVTEGPYGKTTLRPVKLTA